jgi:hypothetical protein
MATFIPNVTDAFPEPSLYRPEFGFLDTMLRRRQSMYEQGFSEIAGKYKQISRSVTNPVNAQVRDKFIKEAMTNLKDLSAMDLSQQQNVQSAANVFQPFYKNTDVLGDMALTSHWDQQESIGDSFRLKDGGKEYSQDNIDYIRQQRKQFENSDPSSWREVYGQRRSYTPYWDWNKEVFEKMKEFKPSRTKIEKLNGMYTITTEDKSYTKEELSKYLDSVLSDKAKQQMKIEASVRYANDPKALAGLYANEVQDAIPIISQKIQETKDRIKREKNPENIKVLQEDQAYYEQRQQQLEGNLKSISSGDLSFIKGNIESLAYDMYYNQNLRKLANGLSHKDIEQTIGYDQVAMMYAKFDHDFALERYKKSLADKEDKKLTEPIPVNTAGTTVKTDLTSLNNQIKSAEAERGKNYNTLRNVVASAIGKSYIEVSEADVKTYVQQHPNEKSVQAYDNSRTTYETAVSRKNNWDLSSKQYAFDQLGADKYNLVQRINQIKEEGRKTIGQSSPTKLFSTGPEMRDIVVNGKVIGKAPVDWKKAEQYYQTGPTGYSQYRSDQQTYDQIGGDIYAANKLGLSTAQVSSALKEYNDLVKSYNTTSREMATVSRKGFTLSGDDPRQKKVISQIEAITGNTGKIGAVNYFPTSTSFDMEFSLNDLEGKITGDAIKNLETQLQANMDNSYQGVSIKYNDERKVFVAKNLGNVMSSASALNPYATVNPVHRQVLQALDESLVPVQGKETSTLMTMSGKSGNIVVGITKIAGYSAGDNSYMLSINNKTLPTTFNTSLEAYSKAAAAVNSPENMNALLKGL